MQISIHLIQHYSTFFHIIYDEYTYPNRATSCYEKAKPQQKYPRSRHLSVFQLQLIHLLLNLSDIYRSLKTNLRATITILSNGSLFKQIAKQLA